MKKIIQITTEAGFVYEFPAEIVAKSRATYYAASNSETTYDEEFSYTMGDNSELANWLFNNMDESDVEEFAVLVKQPVAKLDFSEAESYIFTKEE